MGTLGVQAAQQEHARDRAGAADDRVDAVSPGLNGQPAGPHGADEDPGRQRQQQQAGVGGRQPGDDLQIQRQEDDGPEQRAADEEPQPRPDRKDAVAKQPRRQQRMLDVRLPADEQTNQEHAGGGQPGGGRVPHLRHAFLHAHEGQQQQADPGRQQRRARVVDAGRTMHRGQPQHDPDDGERRAPHRQVDEEHPAPGRVVDDEAAQQGSDDAGEHPHAGQVADVAAALPGRDDVADHGERQAHHPAGADALHAARQHQRQHVGRKPREDRSDQEDQDGGLERDAPPVDVAELAVERGADRRAQQVGGHHPRVVVEPAELADNRRERRGDDGLVERREKEPGHEAGEDDDDLPVRERFGRRRRRHRGRSMVIGKEGRREDWKRKAGDRSLSSGARPGVQ